jgi:RimJ/RimL family protein N-acetyltransferase
MNITEKETIISYSMDADYRGKGLGLTLLKMGIEKFISENNETSLLKDSVKKINVASCKTFEKLCFKIDKNHSESKEINIYIPIANCIGKI